MINEELLKYIENERLQSRDDNTIRTNLNTSGWVNEDTDEAFKSFDSKNLPENLKGKLFSPLSYFLRVLKYTFLFFIFFGIFEFLISYFLDSFVLLENHSNGSVLHIAGIIISILISIAILFYISLRKKILNKEKIDLKKDILNKKNIFSFIGVSVLSLLLVFIIFPIIFLLLFINACFQGGGC